METLRDEVKEETQQPVVWTVAAQNRRSASEYFRYVSGLTEGKTLISFGPFRFLTL